MDEVAVDSAFKSIKVDLGKIDVLIANVGYLSDMGPLAKSEISEWYSGFEINVKGNLVRGIHICSVISLAV